MNILLLAPQPFFQNRGTPIAVRELALTLTANGHRIDLVTFHEGEDLEIPGCQIHRIHRIPWIRNIQPGFSWKKMICDVILLFKTLQLSARQHYDVVHAVEEAVFVGVVVKWIYRIPFVYDMDSSLPRQLADKYRLPRFVSRVLESCERFAVRNSVGVLAMCESLVEKARGYAPEKTFGLLEDKSLIGGMFNGDEDLRERLSLGGPIVMYVGNLESYQGIDLLLEAHRMVLDDLPDTELIVIGGTPEHIEKYTKRAAQLRIGQRTHFVGPRPNSHLGHFLKQADILVSPRINGENTPMKIYSYLDSGIPVVATKLPTHTQVLNDEIAQLAEPRPRDLAEGMITLLNDPEFRELLAYRAKLHVESRYSPEAFDRKLIDFYTIIECKTKDSHDASGSVEQNLAADESTRHDVTASGDRA